MDDESTYLTRAKAVFTRIEAAFDDVDPDVIDCERSSGDVVALQFAGGPKCVINTQRPTRQIWVACGAEAWHFTWNEPASAWLDPKRNDAELFSTLQQIVQANSPLEISF